MNNSGYNEFVIYKEKLNTNNLLDNNKLFAMIAYKNVFPNDFSDLQQGKGFVYQVFLNKKKYLKEENKKLSSEILDLRNKIYVSEETLLKSIDELYAVYFKSKIGNYFNFKINDKTESDFEDRISFIKALRENPDKVLAQRQSYLGFESYSLEGVFEEIEKNLEFLKRKESVISKEKIKLYQQKISNIELSQSELNSIKLAKVIKRSHLEDLTHDHFTNKSEEFMLIKSSESFDLLVFIIRNGYIDEGYEDYLTYFYPFSITLSDKKYLRSIIDERRLAWDYKIANIDEVFERIHTEYFLVESSLNYDVFKYLLANQNIVGRSNSLRNVFHTIDDTNNLNFLVNVFNIAGSDFKNILIKEWISYSPKLFNNLLSDALYDTVDKVNILIKMFEEITFDDLNMINNNLLTNYIENTEMFLEKVSDFNRSFEESLINLGIKFKEIPFLKINRDVIDFLYQNNLYDINAHNVNGFLLNMFDLTNEYDIKHKNFTLIFNNEKTILGKYILNNIEVYLESYLELSNGMTDDDVSAIYSLLNNEDVSENQKVSYVETINHMNVGIKYVDDFAMKTSLIELNKVKANELNILEYFHSNDNKWSDELIEFVNNNESEIEFRKDVLEEKYEKTSIIDFIKLTVKESRISDTAFDNIFSSIGKIYSEGFNVEGISETKMDILINKELISFSKKNLLVIRKLYPNKVVLFISKHLDFYLSIAGDDSVYNKDELIKVLDDNHDESIARTRKIVDLIETPIPIELKEYNYKLLNYILKNNFTEEDLEYLGVQYDTFTKTTKNIIVNIFVDKIQLTLSQKIDINLTLLNRLLSKETVKIESRQLLFSRSIFKFKKEELRHKFELLLLANYIDVIDNVRRKVKFPNNEINRNIIIYLDENGIISSFSKDELYYYVNSKAKKVHRI